MKPPENKWNLPITKEVKAAAKKIMPLVWVYSITNPGISE
jgi:hypothetical protein